MEENVYGEGTAAGNLSQNTVKSPALTYRSVELRPLLDDVILKVVADIREQKVRFNFEISGGLPLVRGNASDLRVAFTNVLRSALEFMPAGSFLLVSASYFSADGLPERVEVRMENTASGIAGEGDLPSVDPILPGDYEAGLAAARVALISSGGSISMESAPGTGLIFIVSLPVSPSKEGRSM